jgi:hypothetical protein
MLLKASLPNGLLSPYLANIDCGTPPFVVSEG